MRQLHLPHLLLHNLCASTHSKMAGGRLLTADLLVGVPRGSINSLVLPCDALSMPPCLVFSQSRFAACSRVATVQALCVPLAFAGGAFSTMLYRVSEWHSLPNPGWSWSWSSPCPKQKEQQFTRKAQNTMACDVYR